MNVKDARLQQYIRDFIAKKINGEQFETLFTEVYDFEDLTDFDENSELLKQIRISLTRFSTSLNDLKNEKFYIDEQEMRKQIKVIVDENPERWF